MGMLRNLSKLDFQLFSFWHLFSLTIGMSSETKNVTTTATAATLTISTIA
jgi:hypothetical protein